MSDLKSSDLDLEQQAKLDKELAWCIRKLHTKLEHVKKDNKKGIFFRFFVRVVVVILSTFLLLCLFYFSKSHVLYLKKLNSKH